MRSIDDFDEHFFESNETSSSEEVDESKELGIDVKDEEAHVYSCNQCEFETSKSNGFKFHTALKI